MSLNLQHGDIDRRAGQVERPMTMRQLSSLLEGKSMRGNATADTFARTTSNELAVDMKKMSTGGCGHTLKERERSREVKRTWRQRKGLQKNDAKNPKADLIP